MWGGGKGESKRKRPNDVVVACMQTLLISFQRGSPSVESAHWRPNPCSEPRAIPPLEEPRH